MKKMKKIFAVLLTFSLMLGLNVMTASAEEYSYTITLHAGNKGSINGVEGGKEVLTGCHVGDRVSFDMSKITVNDEKYYVKGVRLSGRDNEEVAPAFYVNGDADYVVAYGIKGNMVGYTVKYVDEDGKTLADSETFYGNVGDKPVVAYKYLDGYIPQALAMTKTLSDNEAENVFTFVYHAADPETVINVIPGTVTIVNVPGAQDNANRPGNEPGGNADNNANNNANDNNAEEPGNDDENPEENVDVTEPDDLIDLDEVETPAGNVELNEKDSTGATGLPIAVAGAVGGAALIALIGLLLIVRKRMQSK